MNPRFKVTTRKRQPKKPQPNVLYQKFEKILKTHSFVATKPSALQHKNQTKNCLRCQKWMWVVKETKIQDVEKKKKQKGQSSKGR